MSQADLEQLLPARAVAIGPRVLVDLRTTIDGRRVLEVDQARDLVEQLLRAIDLAALAPGGDVTSWPPLAWPTTR